MNYFSSLFSNSVVSSVAGSTVRDSIWNPERRVYFTGVPPFNPIEPLVFPTGGSNRGGGIIGTIIESLVSY